MKTITERDGKNVNMQVVGDLHQYPDGSVHTVKEGKAVWGEGGGGSGGGSKDYTILPHKGNELFSETVTDFTEMTFVWSAELQAEPITAEWVVIALNGEEYLCHRTFESGEWYYGENTFGRVTFTNYPFTLVDSSGTMFLFVPEDKECTITAYEAYPTAAPDVNFSLAVDSVVNKQEFVGELVDEGEFEVWHVMAQQEFFGLMRRGGVINVDQVSDDSYSSTVSLHLLGYYYLDDPDDPENPSYLLVGNGDGNVYKGILDPNSDGMTRFELQT